MKWNKKYYFYCPKCGFEDRVDRLPNGTLGNLRGGYGTPIHHYECPKCHNLDAGYMTYCLLHGNITQEEAEQYFQYTISLYQNVRGYAK